MISTLILIAMAVAALLLPVSILAHRQALAEPQTDGAVACSQRPHVLRECDLCAPLRHPSHRRTRRVLAALPRQSAESVRRERGGSHG